VIDGVAASEGRILIMTTNHVESASTAPSLRVPSLAGESEVDTDAAARASVTPAESTKTRKKGELRSQDF
jgi:hypothetical protein